MSNSVFKRWTNAVRHLNQKIKNNRLIAGRNIQLENTGYGIRIHSSASDGSVDDIYKGGFKVVKDGENLKVVYGENPSNLHCGSFDVPEQSGYLYVPVVSFPITGNNQYITLTLVYDLAAQQYQATITSNDNGWDYTSFGDNPGLKFYIADYSPSTGKIDQRLQISGGYYGQFTIELQGKYWV